MAKKGGVQHLQADISTNEDFEKFLERPGLLVMDVYTEWCGPCLGMVGSLKKIKLELGGDNLQLAICKADTIDALIRFRNKSEPTWLFASHGKAVNIMFGTNVPKLMKLIASELEAENAYVNKKGTRTFYEITEMQPIELEKYNRVKAAEDRARLAEQQAAEAKRHEYLMYVTNEIMKNMPDMGVTIFGPHIQRDMYKKLMDPADVQKISCKDRRILQVTKSDLEVLHFACHNALSDDVWEYMLEKDLLTCLWKANESDTRPIDEILAKYVHDCNKPQPVVDDFGNIVPGKTLPPILPVLEVKIAPVSTEAEEKEDIPEKEDQTTDNVLAGLLDTAAPEDENEEEEEEEGEEEEDHERKSTIEAAKPNLAEKKEVKILKIPAVWAPGTRRGIAAAIYLFYRWHTGTFLPPDPVPEPPHLAIAFEAYKRKDITDVCDRFKDDILAYGFFTTADPDTAQLITNSVKTYETKTPQVTDKFVLKVAKKTSHALLTLATHGPCYISNDTVTGEKECKKFFPEGYITEGEAQAKAEAEKKKKKKKKKKSEAGEPVPEEVEVAEEGADEAEEEAVEGIDAAEDVEIDVSVAPDTEVPQETEEKPGEISPESEPIPPDQSPPPDQIPIEASEEKESPIEDSKPVAGDENEATEGAGGEASEEEKADSPKAEGAE